MNSSILMQLKLKMKYLNILLFFLLTGCSILKKSSSEPFTTLYKGSNSTITDEKFLLIKDNQDFINTIQKLQVDESQFSTLLNVNFKINDICIVFLGERNTGGYSIEVEKIIKKKNIFYLKMIEEGPGKEDFVTTAITNPYCITVIPKAKNIIIK